MDKWAKLNALVNQLVMVQTFQADITGKLLHRGTDYGFRRAGVNVKFHHDDVRFIDPTHNVVVLKRA